MNEVMREKLPVMEPGKFIIKYELGIHKKAGLTYERLEKHLKSGEVRPIEQVKYLRHSVWGKIPEGWICMYMNQTYYVKKI